MQSTTAIWTQNEASGNYDYKDSSYSKLITGQTTIEYEGSKTGVGNKFIKKGALVFARNKRKDDFTYIGQVTSVEVLRKQTNTSPAKFQLILDHREVNGTPPKTVLKTIPNAGGPKKSALTRMGFTLDASRGGANIQCGLNAIKSTLELV